jgi:alkaline phosphatase D
MWDDHDYGQNDAGKEMPLKKQNREIWLDWIGEPRNTERRLEEDSPIH